MSRVVCGFCFLAFMMLVVTFNVAIVMDAYQGSPPPLRLVQGWDSPIAVLAGVNLLSLGSMLAMLIFSGGAPMRLMRLRS